MFSGDSTKWMNFNYGDNNSYTFWVVCKHFESFVYAWWVIMKVPYGNRANTYLLLHCYIAVLWKSRSLLY